MLCICCLSTLFKDTSHLMTSCSASFIEDRLMFCYGGFYVQFQHERESFDCSNDIVGDALLLGVEFGEVIHPALHLLLLVMDDLFSVEKQFYGSKDTNNADRLYPPMIVAFRYKLLIWHVILMDIKYVSFPAD
ncbi:hypothetical protein DPMN_154616 [Dreissena polymorpha]|uniref:Uncharacterized protein n=1 Tax=Dreissena polymorpha TaxID=45954 RepID=A0A9D4FS47_DREPO|nr:hypothetical protein DPMN_154616 [Dreissena polymorpha]